MQKDYTAFLDVNADLSDRIRKLYNETELSSNTVEVNNAIQLLKAESSEVKGDGDTGGTRLWWDRKDKGNF